MPSAVRTNLPLGEAHLPVAERLSLASENLVQFRGEADAAFLELLADDGERFVAVVVTQSRWLDDIEEISASLRSAFLS